MTATRSDSAHVLFSFLTSVIFFPRHAIFSSCVSMTPKIEQSLKTAIKKLVGENTENPLKYGSDVSILIHRKSDAEKHFLAFTSQRTWCTESHGHFHFK